MNPTAPNAVVAKYQIQNAIGVALIWDLITAPRNTALDAGEQWLPLSKQNLLAS